jgi:hypothetical protein
MRGFEDPGQAGMQAAKGAAGLAEELRRTTAKVKATEARRAEAERRRRDEREKKEARALADRLIAELPEKMREAAAQGDNHYVVFQWLSKRYQEVAWRAWPLVQQHAKELGMKTGESRMDPFGSDPMFDYPVWTLWIEW